MDEQYQPQQPVNQEQEFQTSSPQREPLQTPQLNKELLIYLIVGLVIAGLVFGYYIWQKGGPVSVLPTPTVSSTPTPTPDPTADWQTYRNEQYGFEVKLPDNFIQDDEVPAKDDDAVLECFKSENVNGTVFCVRQEGSFNIIAIQQKFAPTGLEDYPPEKLTLGANAFYYYGAGGGVVRYSDLYFYNLNGKLLVFAFDDLLFNDKTPSDETKTLAKLILSTFKFIETSAGQFCGGIAGVQCPSGYLCKLDGNYPDAGGVCVK
jgi:hypothetical protein